MESEGQPCARTWTKLSNILLHNKELSDDDIEMHAIAYVGQGVGQEFSAYVASAKKVRVEDVLRKPSMINDFLNAKDLSMAYAVIQGIVERYREDKKVMRDAFEVALAINREELGSYLIRQLKNIDEAKFYKNGTDAKIVDPELAERVTKKYARYLVKEVQ
jgi:hypothetical protein